MKFLLNKSHMKKIAAGPKDGGWCYQGRVDVQVYLEVLVSYLDKSGFNAIGT